MLLTFILLALAICAVWLPPIHLRGSVFLPPWALLFGAATISGLVSGVLGWKALPVLILLFLMAEMSRRAAVLSARIATMVIAGLIAVGLGLHLFPGFYNPIVLDGLSTGPNARPITQYANFDKAAAGLVVLAYFSQRIQSVHDIREIWAATTLAAIATAVVVIGLGLATDYLAFDPKLPSFAISFLAINLLFVCVAEEAFFRGFIQERISRRLNSDWQWLAVAVSSLLFGVVHLAGGTLYALLATLVGLGCAVVYAQTRRVEAPILVHFSFNVGHFLLFTYPSAL